MTLLARIAVVLVTLVCAEASKNVTAKIFIFNDGTASPAGQYFGDCALWGQSDLRWERSLIFDRLDTKCVSSAYCSNTGAKMTYAYCTNTNLGSSFLTYTCRTTFEGSFYATNVTVSCPGYTTSTPCVYTNQCELQYTPRPGGQTYGVYGGVGGTVGFILFCALIYWCCRRRISHTTTTTIIRNVPAPAPAPRPEPVAAQTNVTVNMQAPTATYPAQQYAPPAYPVPAYPAPAYSAPAPPPFNPNYMAPQPPKQGYY